MKRRVTGIAGAVVLALVGTLILVAYVQSAKSNASASTKLTSVLVVTKTINRGTAASAIGGSVKAEQVPGNLKASSAVSDIGALKGLVASADLEPGEQVLSSRFVTPQAAASALAPPDKLRVTVSLEGQRVIGGQIKAGDTVAVLLSFSRVDDTKFTHLTLHQVLVTDVQTDGSQGSKSTAVGSSSGPTGNLLITLALDAPSVEKVVFAAEWGKIWLAQEPSTAPQDGTKVVDLGNVYQ